MSEICNIFSTACTMCTHGTIFGALCGRCNGTGTVKRKPKTEPLPPPTANDECSIITGKFPGRQLMTLDDVAKEVEEYEKAATDRLWEL
jgi:hypothetical protein